MTIPAFAISDGISNRAKRKALTKDQKILHVLNRLGFGARPGNVEKVKSMGLNRYIERQLDPDSIPDADVQAKLKGYEINQKFVIRMDKKADFEQFVKILDVLKAGNFKKLSIQAEQNQQP